MRALYTAKDIDILKRRRQPPRGEPGLPAETHDRVRRQTIQPRQRSVRNAERSYRGGQSLVFTRYHEASVTQIRPHRVKQPKLCKRVIGYDANALYLSTMLRAVPCGEEKVVRYHYLSNAVPAFTGRLKAGTWFGFAEVDIEIPQKLWMKFEKMPPFFFTK